MAPLHGMLFFRSLLQLCGHQGPLTSTFSTILLILLI